MKKYLLNTAIDAVMISVVSIGLLAILTLAVISIYCK